MEEIQIHSSKRSRIGNGIVGVLHHADPIGQQKDQRQHQKDDEEEGGEARSARFWAWHQQPSYSAAAAATATATAASSRICRVSRASGGKDRHSKVLTAKGLRDRRVRLSVSTAIQFYDLQDRLGYDQPSKAVEWLIKAAAAAIGGLPSLDGPFPEQPLHPPPPPGGEEKPTPEQQQHISLSKSACSSTSETSKGSVSLSRSEIRVKARERARERTANDKDKERGEEDDAQYHHQGVIPNPNPHSSFTELLTGGGSGNNPVTVAQAKPGPNFSHKQQHLLHHLPPSTATTTTDYFGQAAALFTPGQKPHQPPPSGLPTQAHFGTSSPVGMIPFNITAATGHNSEMQQQQFSFLPEHLIPVAAAAGGDYTLNFSISSGLAGFNRGTLQSNSSSPLPHHHHPHPQRISSQVDGSNLPFFFGTPAPAPSASGDQNQFSAGFDGRLQLYYGDGYRHSEPKGKEKS